MKLLNIKCFKNRVELLFLSIFHHKIHQIIGIIIYLVSEVEFMKYGNKSYNQGQGIRVT